MKKVSIYRRMAAHVDKILKGTRVARSRSNKRRHSNLSLIKKRLKPSALPFPPRSWFAPTR